MRRTLAVLAVAAAVTLDARPAAAQVVVGPVGYAANFSFHRYGWGFAGPGFAYGGFSRGYQWNVAPVWGPVAVGPWGAYGGVYANPYLGWGWGVPVAPPPVVIVQQAAPQPLPRGIAGGFNRFRDDAEPDVPAGVPDIPARPKGDFLVVKPIPDGVGRPPVRPRIPDPADPAGPKFVRPPAGGGLARGLVVPPADPKDLAVFHVRLARFAFADEQYGRAAEQLAFAIAATPADPVPYFLLAQVRTATGDYAGAVAAIRDGMTRDPDWPVSTFRVRELYGRFPARFDDHFAELKAVSAANPGDPTLAFLVGYHLWFLGDKADAAKLFRRAAERVRDPGIVERFLLEFDNKKA